MPSIMRAICSRCVPRRPRAMSTIIKAGRSKWRASDMPRCSPWDMAANTVDVVLVDSNGQPAPEELVQTVQASVSNLSEDFRFLGSYRIGGVFPVIILVFFVMFAISAFLLTQTRFGKKLSRCPGAERRLPGPALRRVLALCGGKRRGQVHADEMPVRCLPARPRFGGNPLSGQAGALHQPERRQKRRHRAHLPEAFAGHGFERGREYLSGLAADEAWPRRLEKAIQRRARPCSTSSAARPVPRMSFPRCPSPSSRWSRSRAASAWTTSCRP